MSVNIRCCLKSKLAVCFKRRECLDDDGYLPGVCVFSAVQTLELDEVIRQTNMQRQAELEAELLQSVKQPR